LLCDIRCEMLAHGVCETLAVQLNTKDRARIHHNQQLSPDHATTCFPSSGTGAVQSSSLSPFTPGEPPRTTTPVTPAAAAACQQQSESSPTRKLLNPARLLVSTKRLAFWNFSSSTSVDDAASLNNRSANPTPEVELQVPEQLDCSSILDEVPCARIPPILSHQQFHSHMAHLPLSVFSVA
jgi:hypothetical protein